MSRFDPPALWHSGAAALGVAVATLVRFALDPLLGDHLPFIFYFAAVVVAWHGGRGPALLALALSAPVALWLFVPPRGALGPLAPRDAAGLAAFAAVGLAIALYGGALRESRRRAEGSAGVAHSRQEELECEVAERRRAEEQVRAGREHFRITLASIGDAVIVTDVQMRHLSQRRRPATDRLRPGVPGRRTGHRLSHPQRADARPR
jgi:PAS domain-containing protein